jgi:hypothetical protein
MSERAKVTVKAPVAKTEKAVARVRQPEGLASCASPYERVILFQRTFGNQAVQRLYKSGVIQAKLKLGKPNDIYEQEADRVAEQVMRMPDKQHIDSSCRSGYSPLALSYPPSAISHPVTLKSQAPNLTIQRDEKGSKTKALPAWSAYELKKMLDVCDGGLGIWAKAKKANDGKDPVIAPGSIAPFLGLTWRRQGTITLEEKLDKCSAAQVLIFELTNLSRKADFDAVDLAAGKGEVSRDQYIWRNEKIERESSLVNEIRVFDACKAKWACKPHQRVLDPRLLYLDMDEYMAYLAKTAKSHLEHYGTYWDRTYKDIFTGAHALCFTEPIGAGKRCFTKGLGELTGAPAGEGADWSQVRGERVNEGTLGVWLRRTGMGTEIAQKHLLSSHMFTGSENARKYWAYVMKLRFDDLLKAEKPAQ